MACNIPVIATEVGDVKWLLKGLEGCYITSHNFIDITDKLSLTLNFNARTTGREKLIQHGLDSESVAQKIIKVYKNILND